MRCRWHWRELSCKANRVGRPGCLTLHLPGPHSLPLQWSSAANMVLIAFGVVVCALGEANLVLVGLVQQLVALLFEVGARLMLVAWVVNGMLIASVGVQAAVASAASASVCSRQKL